MALGTGLVGIDSFLIAPMFPTIAKDLDLNYGDISMINAALAPGFAIAALFMGNLSDHVGRRKVLVGSMVAFTLMIGASGLAEGVIGLILVRIMMGFADGAFMAPSISATLEAAPPKHRGLAMGFKEMMLPLCGLALAPFIVGMLLPHMSWRWIFILFSIPALVVTIAVWYVFPHEPEVKTVNRSILDDWRIVLTYRNIWVLMGIMFCCVGTLVSTTGLMPSFLIDYRQLSHIEMGSVMASIGFGAVLGNLTLPMLSDYIGRRPILLVSALVITVALWELAHAETMWAIFFWLGTFNLFNFACITLCVGPIASETVPTAQMATATGILIATGQLTGGMIIPVAVGQVADNFGIEHILWVPMALMGIAFFLALFLKETRQN